MSNENDNSVNGSPWWVKAVYIVGVPSAIAIYLVYWVTTGVTADHEVLAAKFDRASQFWAQICRNTAATLEDRQACTRIERGYPPRLPDPW